MELLNSIKSTLYERASSRLVPGIIVSWLVVNWRVLMALIYGDAGYQERIDSVSNLLEQGTWYENIWHHVGIPFLVVSAFHTIVPWLDMFLIQLNEHWISLKIQYQQSARKKRLLTEEQSNSIRLKIAEQEKKYGEIISGYEEKIATLEKRLSGLTKPTDESMEEKNIELVSSGSVDDFIKYLPQLLQGRFPRSSFQGNSTDPIALGLIQNAKDAGNGTTYFALTTEGRKFADWYTRNKKMISSQVESMKSSKI